MSQLMILDGYDNPLGNAPGAKRKRSNMAGKKKGKGKKSSGKKHSGGLFKACSRDSKKDKPKYKHYKTCVNNKGKKL